jgi:ferrochelatase
MTAERRGALLMTYGSPASLDRQDIAAYLTRVRGGREPDTELVDEFTRRYRVIGGSPLIDITRRQAAGLSARLGWPVEVGMRFSHPSIESGLRSLSDRGAALVVAIILSPQFSPLLMGGYARDLDEACRTLGERAPEVILAGAWHEEPAFIEALAGRIRHALETHAAPRAQLPATPGVVPVLLTAHSLPRRVAHQEPGYLEQLRVTAEHIARAADLTDGQWRFCWQSAGHEPGEWMAPDFADVMPELARAGHAAVVVAPVQFLADHLEILYDVDVGAREQAEDAGLAFSRIASLNEDPGLIAALAAVAEQAVGAAGARP